MAYQSFFHRAMESLNLHQWKRAEKWLYLALKREKHPLAREYLLFVWLVTGKWKRIKAFFSSFSYQLESIGWYVRYWYLWWQESWLELEPCLYQMVASENIFVRVFGLFRLSRYHQKPVDEFLSRHDIFSGLCAYREEEQRALRYERVLRGEKADDHWENIASREDMLDLLLLGIRDEVRSVFSRLSARERKRLENDPRLVWEMARFAFEAGEYTWCERLLKRLEGWGFMGSVVWYLLGHVAAAQGRWQRAGLWYEKAIDAGLDVAPAWKNLAILTLQKGYLREASVYLKESLRLKNDPEIIYALAIVHLRRRQYIQAYELLRRCLAYDEVRVLAEKQISVLKRFLRETAY